MFERFIILVVLLTLTYAPARADDKVRSETRVDRLHAMGYTGQGVIVAVLGSGIDYAHPDFRRADGTSRILYLYDMTDDAGAGAPENLFGLGTIYSRAQIEAALASGVRLAARDAGGQGTAAAGLAAGNGLASGGLYAGMAPDAELIVVKLVGGAPAHGDEPAEPEAGVRDIEAALDFVIQKAAEEGLPFVALANIDRIGGVPDGTTAWARAVDARFGDAFPGRVFVSGSSDAGGTANHAAGFVPRDASVDLLIHKGEPDALRLELWYSGGDRFDVTVVAPDGTFGPYPAPQNNGEQDERQEAGFTYFHNGANVDFWEAGSQRREIAIDFATPGDYTVRLTRTIGLDGRFDAFLEPARLSDGAGNFFASLAVPGYTVWDMASSQTSITPGAYVLREGWTDVDGVAHDAGDAGDLGDLWAGSGVGPTVDGRYGISVGVPGDVLVAPYAPRSVYAADRSRVVLDDGAGGMYGIHRGVTAAAPVTAGIVALLLQADPLLSALDARATLQQSARDDAFTGDTPNPRFGYGKIDAYAAMARIVELPDAIQLSDALPAGPALTESYPNPFRDAATIRFAHAAFGPARLAVYDLLGREVAVLHDAFLAPGIYEASLDASALPAGAYVLRLDAGGEVRSRVVVRVR
ncbi:MAG: S8 family serine peptidase [Rhodothermales bacterium]